jgi:hypothetical protein
MTTPTLLRSRINDLTTLASRDLTSLWSRLERAADAAEPLRDILPSLIDLYGAAAGTIAAEWYDDLRAKDEIKGRFLAIPSEAPADGSAALVGWALSRTEDLAAFQTLIEGGLQRRIDNRARGTVMGSSVADPQSDGWQRVSRGKCNGGFCDMLAGRGAVYRTESSATFGAHDHCHCVAVPAWSDREVSVKPYTPTLRNVTDADRARVREWIASH